MENTTQVQNAQVEGQLIFPADMNTDNVVKQIDTLSELLVLAEDQLAKAERATTYLNPEHSRLWQEQLGALSYIATNYKQRLENGSHVLEAVTLWNEMSDEDKAEQADLLRVLSKDYAELVSYLNTFEQIKNTVGVASIGDVQATIFYTAYRSFKTLLANVVQPSVGAHFWSAGNLEFLRPGWDIAKFDELANLEKIDIPQPE